MSKYCKSKSIGGESPYPPESQPLISKIFLLTYTVIESSLKHPFTSAINRKHDVGFKTISLGPWKQNNEGVIKTSYQAFRILFEGHSQRYCCHQSTRENEVFISLTLIVVYELEVLLSIPKVLNILADQQIDEKYGLIFSARWYPSYLY